MARDDAGNHDVPPAATPCEDDALRYRALFGGALDLAIIATDPDGRITDWNSGAERIFGWSAAEMRGTSIARIFTDEDRAAGAPAARLREALAQGRITAECWHDRAGGGRLWGSGELITLRGPDGAHLGFLKVLRDTTRRRAHEEALRESEAMLRAAIRAAPFPTMMHAEDGEVLELSSRWLELTGYTRAQIATRQDWVRLAHPGREDAVNALIQSSFGDEADLTNGEWEIRVCDGSTRIWEFHSATLGRLPDGRRLRKSSAVDVTERKASEARLRESEAMLRAAVRAAPFPTMLHAEDGEVLEISRTWLALTGYTRAQIAMRHDWIRLAHPDDEHAINAAIDAAFASNTDAVCDEQVVSTGDGGLRTWEFHGAALGRLPDGRRLRVSSAVDVTERKAAETRLRESESMLRTAVRAAPFPTMLHAEDGEVLELSDTWMELTGYSRAQMSTRHAWVRLAVPDREHEVNAFIDADFAHEREGLTREWEIRVSDGGSRIWEFHTAALGRLPDGRRLRVSSAVDITERKAAETRLRESESMLRAAVLALPFPTMLHAETGEVLALSRKWLELTGYSREQIATRADWFRLAYPGREDENEATIAATFGDQSDVDAGEWQVRIRDGSTRLWHFHGTSLGPQTDGQRLRLSSAVDVTERRASEQRLAEERARLAALIEHLPVGVAFVDREGRTLLSNSALRRFLPDATVGAGQPDGERRWTALDVHGRLVPGTEFPSVRALRGETVPGIDFLHVAPPAPPLWVRVSAAPLRDAAGMISGAVIAIVDIDAERREHEAQQRLNETLERLIEERTAELLSAEASLRQAQKMEAVGQLTGGIAHDFNNLLTAIGINLDLLQVRAATGRTEGLDRFVASAQSAVGRASALTHRLLAFSRQQTLAPRPTDIEELVGGMADLIRRSVGPAIAVAVATPPGLWRCLVDRNQLENALLNLAINARDAMPDGGRLTIAAANRDLDCAAARALDLPAGRYLALSVTDTGTGMPADVAARAFDPFFTTKPPGLGTGLGLSMVYGFVGQSGGQVRIDTAPGAGTTVTLWLPCAIGPLDQAPADGAPDAAAPAVRRATVRVVEDDAAVRAVLTEALTEMGYDAPAVGDAEAALHLLQAGAKADLMVIDIGLPGSMNGRQLAAAARALRPDLKLLLVSGYPGAVPEEADTDIPILAKPFAIHTLASRVSDLLGSE